MDRRFRIPTEIGARPIALLLVVFALMSSSCAVWLPFVGATRRGADVSQPVLPD